MKNIYKIALFITASLFVGCDDELDINTSPNFPQQINAGLALTSAETSLATTMGGDLMNLGGIWNQYYTQAPSAAQYRTMEQYNLNTVFANNLWTELYSGCLTDLKYVQEDSAEKGNTGTALIATVLRAYTYQVLVDIFDAVPYTEALQGDLGNITPSPTPGDEIYADLLVTIDAALAAYNANPVPSDVAKQDIIYNADMDNWIKFANTLKLKLYIRMAYTPQANPAAVNALLAENNFLTTDAMYANFVSTTDKTNPFYGVQISSSVSGNGGTGLGDVNDVASSTLYEYYLANEDPRVTAAYRYVYKTTTHRAIPQGSFEEFTGTAPAFSRPNIRPTTPVFLLTAAESNFLQAEALIRYAGGTGAKEKYDAGVAASFATYAANFFQDEEVTDESVVVFNTEDAADAAADLTAAGGAYEYVAGGDVETQVRQVIMQKWAALPNINNIESWIETTRTKFPEIVPEGSEDYAIGNRIPSLVSVLTGTTVPSTLFYPLDEVTRNPNLPQKASLTQKVWWDQK